MIALNGDSVATNSRLKQPLKSKPVNERQANANAPKHSGKPDPGFCEGTTEKPKLKKKGLLIKLKETESSSPIVADAKACRFGTLPNYGFSFKCDERAEKRQRKTLWYPC